MTALILKWLGFTTVKALLSWAIGKYALAPVFNFLADRGQKLIDDPTTDVDEKAVAGLKAYGLHYANKTLKQYM